MTLGFAKDAIASDGGRRSERRGAPSCRTGVVRSADLRDLFWRRPKLLLLLLLLPPALWLGIVYVGSLLALLLQSFFHIDDFSGLIVQQFTLATYARAVQAAERRHHPAHGDDGRAGDAGLGGRRVPDRLSGGALCSRAAGRRCSISAVMLPLWSSYLVKVYAWKLILAKEGILTWVFAQAASGLRARCDPGDAGDRRQLAVLSASSARSWCFVYIWLPYMILPIQAALERVPVNLIDASADLGAPPLADVPARDLPAGAAGDRRRLDLHLLADAGRLHHPADHRERRGCSSARSSTRSRARPATSRWPPPSRWCRSSSWGSTSGAREAHGGVRCALMRGQRAGWG